MDVDDSGAVGQVVTGVRARLEVDSPALQTVEATVTTTELTTAVVKVLAAPQQRVS